MPFINSHKDKRHKFIFNKCKNWKLDGLFCIIKCTDDITWS